MRIATLTWVWLLAAPLMAQGLDDRDVVRKHNGDEVRGRVSRYHGPEEIVLMQGQQRVRIHRDKIASIETVNDRLREFYARLDTGINSAKYRWILAEWSKSRRLDGMAAALALEIVIDDDSHERAHEMLGHKRTKRGWLWPLGDRFVSRKRYLDYHSDMGHPLAVAGEHYIVETDADPKAAIYALLDLERMYLHWQDTFGARLQLREVLLKMRARIWKLRKKMPGMSKHKRPYVASW
ncbi:MAG: hypothetical protein AB8H80_10140 [Planctomycetota bacterium]